MALRTGLALATLLAGLVVAVGPVGAGLADRVGATFALMAEDFIKATQPLDGIVVAVEGPTVYLDIGAQEGARVGQELTVFRRGEPFFHPYTGRTIGRYEDVLGHAQIRRVDEQFSEALYIPMPDAPDPRPEDGARISRGRIRIAVTPVLDLTNGDADVRRVPYLMASILERSKRFLVVDPLAVTDMFANGALRVEEVLARPERAMRIAKNLEVGGWLIPVLLERRGVMYLDATWISAITGTALFSRRLPVVPAGTADAQRFPWEPRPED
ncbi:MAG: hypothetical protein ACREJV_12100 [Candidatus Rokuibacteriota bacterium]